MPFSSQYFQLQYIPPNFPDGIVLYDILVTVEDHLPVDNEDGSIFDATISMELIPLTCVANIPLVRVESTDHNAPG